jgi:hypothetical protein
MALTVTELADEVRETNRCFTDANDTLPDEVSDLKTVVAEMNVSLKFIKWIGGYLAICASGFLAIEYSAVQRITRIESAVSGTREDIKDIKTGLLDRDTWFARTFDRIEKRLPQVTPAQPKAEKEAPAQPEADK